MTHFVKSSYTNKLILNFVFFFFLIPLLKISNSCQLRKYLAWRENNDHLHSCLKIHWSQVGPAVRPKHLSFHSSGLPPLQASHALSVVNTEAAGFMGLWKSHRLLLAFQSMHLHFGASWVTQGTLILVVLCYSGALTVKARFPLLVLCALAVGSQLRTWKSPFFSTQFRYWDFCWAEGLIWALRKLEGTKDQIMNVFWNVPIELDFSLPSYWGWVFHGVCSTISTHCCRMVLVIAILRLPGTHPPFPLSLTCS